MIKKVAIRNFQSHKNTDLEFDKGVNVIIGSSDSGKTAIIRALKWLIYNKPNGDDFRSYWGGDTSVEMEVEDNVITRTRSNSQNLYKLASIKEPFAAFGFEVPEEIKGILNMEDVNIQQQLDSIFLLSKTSGEVASFFNKIAKLDKIDIGLQNITKSIKHIKQTQEHLTKYLKDKQEDLKVFENLQDFEKDLQELEDLEIQLNKKITNKDSIISKIETLEDIEKKLTEKYQIIYKEPEIDILLDLYKSKTEKDSQYQTIKKLSLKIFYTQKDIIAYEKAISYETVIEELLKLYNNHTETSLHLKKINKLYNDIVNNQKSQETALKSILELEKYFHDNFPAECPICGTEIKK